MPNTVKAEPDLWSESSKRSYAYHYIKEYGDAQFLCRKCGGKGVFSAEAQKRSYEVKKNYIWQGRYLCDPCFKEWLLLKQELDRYYAAWLSEKPLHLQDREFQERWLTLLKSVERYSAHKDCGNIRMLEKLLHDNTYSLR